MERSKPIDRLKVELILIENELNSQNKRLEYLQNLLNAYKNKGIWLSDYDTLDKSAEEIGLLVKRKQIESNQHEL